ncbi:MAG: hypothetical protein AAGH89_01890 [Verrucomicrobiota bacterium]
MKPNSFGGLCLAVFAFFASACSQKMEEPLLGRETILERLTSAPHLEIYETKGAEGPYKKVVSHVGHYNSPMTVWASGTNGKISVDCPAKEGYAFNVDVYQNEGGAVFMVAHQCPENWRTLVAGTRWE